MLIIQQKTRRDFLLLGASTVLGASAFATLHALTVGQLNLGTVTAFRAWPLQRSHSWRWRHPASRVISQLTRKGQAS
jgi:hypothetical protein